MLPVVAATRYITPLREGGSLPGLMESDDLGAEADRLMELLVLPVVDRGPCGTMELG